MTFLDGLTYGAGQAVGSVFTFLILAAGVALLARWLFKRLVG